MQSSAEAVTALNRLAFGADPESLAQVGRAGLADWVAGQLAPDDRADTACRERLARATLRIRYPAGETWPAVDEIRPLATLDLPVERLWRLGDSRLGMAYAERQRPRQEVAAATLIRAVHSRWPLREVMVDFWHNHFSVNATADASVAAALPDYDRTLRAHALGNFRDLLEAVASAPAMLIYLSGRSSRAGAANENYARELFELHTLGRDAYLAETRRWRDVPGAAEGAPAGYVDDDVYEAARAFTGWAIEDGGQVGGEQRLPVTGRFVYVAAWHDNYQKRVLGAEFDPYQAAMADGRRVLDLVANHPATARHIAGRLARRLVADAPPAAVVDRAAQVFAEARRAPDQIAQVVRALALMPEVRALPPAKAKRPLEVAASLCRAAGIDLSPTDGLLGEIEGAGQRLFAWPSANGHPDVAAYWLATNAMRRRWQLVTGLIENSWGTGVLDPLGPLAGAPVPAAALAAHWIRRLWGVDPDDGMLDAFLAAINLHPRGIVNPSGTRDPNALARRVVAAGALAPAFHVR